MTFRKPFNLGFCYILCVHFKTVAAIFVFCNIGTPYHCALSVKTLIHVVYSTKHSHMNSRMLLLLLFNFLQKALTYYNHVKMRSILDKKLCHISHCRRFHICKLSNDTKSTTTPQLISKTGSRVFATFSLHWHWHCHCFLLHFGELKLLNFRLHSFILNDSLFNY